MKLNEVTEEVSHGKIFARVEKLPGKLPAILKKIKIAPQFRTAEVVGSSIWVGVTAGVFVGSSILKAAVKEDSFIGVRAEGKSVFLVFNKAKI